ncbi:hypothetical protein BUALT_Bualt06G0101200 [Buddleja alternifolia]|uniref:Uncharacterized protein n=1 Tax=Buddleja alternifolia TaxID=168488 RepID=A0AAV6XQ25_9LAMI|nr:hypothetical protein BUALT_Bualt06G0101200 [Buddleja alternifolia]
MQFLMGLNDNFKPIRGQILLMKPLPSIEDAYCMIQQEERQMDMHSFSSAMDNSAFMVSNNSSKVWNHNNQASSGTQVWNSVNKKNLWCEHCQTTGHTQAKCFRLHGFPPNWKPKGKRNNGGFQKSQSHNVAHGNSLNQSLTSYNYSPMGTSDSYTSDVNSSQAQVNNGIASHPLSPQLTPDQVTQLLTLLNKQNIHTHDHTSHLAGPCAEDACGAW